MALPPEKPNARSGWRKKWESKRGGRILHPVKEVAAALSTVPARDPAEGTRSGVNGRGGDPEVIRPVW